MSLSTRFLRHKVVLLVALTLAMMAVLAAPSFAASPSAAAFSASSLSTPSLSAASAGYTSIKVSWTAVQNAAGYRLYRATSASGSYTKVADFAILSFVDGGRVTGKTYYYRVRAYELSGSTKVFGAYSATKSAKAVPSAVGGITSTKTSATSIALKWPKATGDSGYEVYYATAAAGPYSFRKRTTVNSLADSGLTTERTYYYKIRAYHVEGTSRVRGPFSGIVAMGLHAKWSRVDVGNVIASGQSLSSPRSQYSLTMQSDGNLVLRYVSSGRAIWASGTNGHSGARAMLRHDGDFVVLGADGKTLWHSATSGRSSAYVRLQDDGNLVVYYAGGAKGISGINTVLKAGDRLHPSQYLNSADGRYRLIMQSDGNLVLYDLSQDPDKALWATATTGNNYAVMQGDGNFVVYRSGGTALWASGTNGSSGAWLAVQNDGNVVLYNGAAVWSWRSGKIGAGPIFPVNLSAGQWYGLTYAGHEIYGNNQYSAIDLNMAGDADHSQNIYAIEDGTVYLEDNSVWIQHSKPLVLKNGTTIGTWISLYGHLAKNGSLVNGASVKKGAVLGTVSNSGADNSHLHFVICRNWNNDRASAISPYWLSGAYSANKALYADDQYGTRVDGTEPGLYDNRIFSTPPTQ